MFMFALYFGFLFISVVILTITATIARVGGEDDAVGLVDLRAFLGLPEERDAGQVESDVLGVALGIVHEPLFFGDPHGFRAALAHVVHDDACDLPTLAHAGAVAA